MKRKRDKVYLHLPSGERCQHHKLVRGDHSLIEVMFLTEGLPFRKVPLTELKEI